MAVPAGPGAALEVVQAEAVLELAVVVLDPVGAENLCHQAIFMNHAPCAVTPLDPELIQVGDAVG